MVNLVGVRLEKYQLDRVLGSGGVSTVYLAHDVETGQRCAVKVLLPHLAEDRELARQFRDGGHLTAGLQHPNIVRIYRVGEDQGHSFIAMEQLSGGTLARRLRGRRWPLPHAIALLAQVAAALDYVHERGIVHRDVNPNNVLFSADGKRAVLCDFGISQSLLRPEQSARPDRSGTLLYMSPEQCQGRPTDRATDIYSLAVMAYQMLTGRPPFYAEEPMALMHQQIRQTPPSPRSINRAIPPHVEQTLLRGLAKNPAERYRTAGDFVRALAGERPPWTPGPQTPPSKEPDEPANPTPRRVRAWPFLLVGLLVVVSLIAGWVWPLLFPTATPTFTATRTATPGAPASRTGTPTRTVAPTFTTPTATQQPTSTRAPAVLPTTASPPTVSATAPVLPMAVCKSPQIAQITYPRVGQVVTGPISVTGTAAGPGFVKYELYYKPAEDPGDWKRYLPAPMSVAVINGTLGAWDPASLNLAPGNYLLHLRVGDYTGNYQECSVPVVVK